MSLFYRFFSPGVLIAVLLAGGIGTYGVLSQKKGTEEQGEQGALRAAFSRPLYELSEIAALWQSMEDATTSIAAAEDAFLNAPAEKTLVLAPTPVSASAVSAPAKKTTPTCSKESAPVCGENGMTYKNVCLADTSGVTVRSLGACAAEPTEEILPPAAPTPVEEPESKAEETPLPGAHPDYVAHTVSYYGAPLFEGASLSFSGMIKNNGTERSFDLTSAVLYIDVGNDGKFELSFSPQEVIPLGIGQETGPFIWKNAWTQTSGMHTFAICADAAKVLQETLEENNCETKEFTVLGKADNADMVVTSTASAPASLTIGTRMTFSATVKNTGVRRATSPKFKLIVDGIPQANNTMLTPREENGNDRDLEPGEEDMISWPGNWYPRATGTYTYRICVDSNDEIAEVNEEDNCKDGTFVVPS